MVIAFILLFLLVFWSCLSILNGRQIRHSQSRIKMLSETESERIAFGAKGGQKQQIRLSESKPTQSFILQQWRSYNRLYRQKRLLKDLPDALDLLCVCMEAGLSMEAALVKVAHEMAHHKSALGKELDYLSESLAAGLAKDKALRQFAQKIGGTEVHQLVSLLIQAERFGTSIVLSLRVHADMLREQMRLKAQENASKVGLKLLLPLVFCHLPCLFIVLLGPAGIQLYRTLSPLWGQS